MTKNKIRKQSQRVLKLFSEEGSKHGLSFSSQEMLRSKIIGLDGLKLTLLIFDFKGVVNVTCITMAEVKKCSVQKIYDSILIGTERKPKYEPHLRSIDLHFVFKNNSEPVSVSFYESSINSIYEMEALEAKAKTWEKLLSKVVFKELKATA